jgi:hypothetical protein
MDGAAMHAVVLVIVLGLPALLIALIVLLVANQGGPPRDHEATVVAARRHESRISAAAAAASVCSALAFGNPAVVTWGPPGVLLGLAPFVAALTFCLARLSGETRWPRPTGEVRSAPLVRRSVRDQGGWRLPLFVGTAVGLAVALVVFALTAADDGRSVERVVTSADGIVVETHAAGPYPDWELGGPALVALLLVVGAAVLALRAVTRRPPIGLLSPAQDDAIRRTSAARVLGGAQAWVGLGATGYLAFAAGALLRVDELAGGIACLILAVVAFVGSLVVATTALTPRRAGAADSVPRTAPAEPSA